MSEQHRHHDGKCPSESVPTLRLMVTLMSYSTALRDAHEAYDQILACISRHDYVTPEEEQIIRNWYNSYSNLVDSFIRKFDLRISESREDMEGGK